MFVFPGYAIDQSRIELEEVDPNFVVATLICFLETQHAVRDSYGSMHTDLPFIFGTQRFEESTHIRPFTWHASWSPQQCGAGWKRQARIDESFFNTADGPRVPARLAAPCGTIEVSSNQVDLLLVHCGTDCKQQVLRDSSFLAHVLLMWSDIIVK